MREYLETLDLKTLDLETLDLETLDLKTLDLKTLDLETTRRGNQMTNHRHQMSDIFKSFSLLVSQSLSQKRGEVHCYPPPKIFSFTIFP